MPHTNRNTSEKHTQDIAAVLEHFHGDVVVVYAGCLRVDARETVRAAAVVRPNARALACAPTELERKPQTRSIRETFGSSDETKHSVPR